MADENLLTNDELELRWPPLRDALDKRGVIGCLSEIQAEVDNARRNQLYRLAVRKLGGGVGATSAELDAMITIGDAAIRDLIEVANGHPPMQRAGKTTRTFLLIT